MAVATTTTVVDRITTVLDKVIGGKAAKATGGWRFERRKKTTGCGLST
jgi:hypothetical protein